MDLLGTIHRLPACRAMGRRDQAMELSKRRRLPDRVDSIDRRLPRNPGFPKTIEHYSWVGFSSSGTWQPYLLLSSCTPSLVFIYSSRKLIFSSQGFYVGVLRCFWVDIVKYIII
jgi:hypothetical protein